jgi:hypothetical protein
MFAHLLLCNLRPICTPFRLNPLLKAHSQRVHKNISSKFKNTKQRKPRAAAEHRAAEPLRSPVSADGGGGELRGEVLQVRFLAVTKCMLFPDGVEQLGLLLAQRVLVSVFPR